MLFTDMERGNCTMCYESVIGFGVVEEVPEDQKKEALDKQYEKNTANKALLQL